jgi:hypothetical protein
MSFNHLSEATGCGLQEHGLLGLDVMMNIAPTKDISRRKVSLTTLLAAEPGSLLLIPTSKADVRGDIKPRLRGQICDDSKMIGTAEALVFLRSRTTGEPAYAVLARVAPADARKLKGLASLNHVLFKPVCK